MRRSTDILNYTTALRRLTLWYGHRFYVGRGSLLRALLRRRWIRSYLPATVTLRLPSGFRMELDLDQYIDNHLYWFGVFEPEVGNFLKRSVALSDKCVDVGAHIGYFTLLMSQLVGSTGRVYAFEPEPNNFAALKHNLELNDIQNVEPVCAALTNWNGQADLRLAEASNRYGSGVHSLLPTKHTSDKVIQVKSMTWDEFSESRDILAVDFVKLDCEGGELLVLEGMEQLLRQSVSTLIVEVNKSYLNVQGKSVKEFKAFLGSFGYVGHKLRPDGSLVGCRMDGEDHTSNMIFLPVSQV